jgi:biotin synthase-like enzyme
MIMDRYRKQAERSGDTFTYFSYARAVEASRTTLPKRKIVTAAAAFVVFAALTACAAFAGHERITIGFMTLALIVPVDLLRRRRGSELEEAHRVVGRDDR